MMHISFLPPNLKYVEQQSAFFHSVKRFNVVPAGRRSGKTMTGKVRAMKKALTVPYADGRVILAAPTHKQAKRVFWRDLKRMTERFCLGKPREGDLSVTLLTGVVIEVMGLDVPERAEGAPLDHILLDEYANMKESVWTAHIRPMLAERNGTADFTGTPEGRNHYYNLWEDAVKKDDWGRFTWSSSLVLPPEEIIQLKSDLDPLTYGQEVDANFVNFEGRAYYAFDKEKHECDIGYDPTRDLCFCFDFNVKPGSCVIVQEHEMYGTVVIDEVFIQRYTNTEELSGMVADRYSQHEGSVLLYGDPAGNQRRSSSSSSDWEIIRRVLRDRMAYSDIKMRVASRAPLQRDSINAVNSRMASGHFRINRKCEFTKRDLEGVERGPDGLIIKGKDDMLTHLSDALRYYIDKCFPIMRTLVRKTEI